MKQFLVLSLVSLTPALAGGGLWITSKAPAHNPEAVVFIQVLGCMRPVDAVVTGTVESLVGGKRVSAPLNLKASRSPGLYLVERSTLPAGARLIAVTARLGDQISSELLPLTEDGSLEPGHRGQSLDNPGKFIHKLIASSDIDAALALPKR